MGRRVVGGIAIGVVAAAGAAALRRRRAERHRRPHRHHPAVAAHRRRHDPRPRSEGRHDPCCRRTPTPGCRGDYSFWFTGDTGHARLGEIIAQDDRTVLRRAASASTSATSRRRDAGG